MKPISQKEKLFEYLEAHTLVRARELRHQGIQATVISRAIKSRDIVRVARGLYQLSQVDVDAFITLAEAHKRVPRGVICMTTALAFHGLTDQMPRKVWMAIGAKDWEPKVSYPPLKIVRFRPPYFELYVERHSISGINVPIYSAAKSIADAFRNSRLVDRSVAIECLRNAMTNKIISPAEMAQVSKQCGAWRQIRPYLEALTANG